jgi:hypothetical protein
MKESQSIISKLLIIIACSLILAGASRAQNITNTLGSSGIFRIKDASTTYFSLSQSGGFVELTKSLRLPATTDLNTGVIYKGANRFIHDYKNASNLGQNTFVGVNSGNFTLGGGTFANGSNNTAFGFASMQSLTTGSNNVALGNMTLQFNSTGTYNVGIGSFALTNNTTGNFNVALGMQALHDNTTGTNNVSVGYFTLLKNTTGINNIAIGGSSLIDNLSGNDNIGVGRSTLSNNISGFQNTAVGSVSLSGTTGNRNTAIGYNSGSNLTTGENVTLIGSNSQPSSGTVSNQITLGNNLITSLRCNVQTITSLSDARDKKNIRDLSLGLDFIAKLKPRQFNWDKREWYHSNSSDGSKMETHPTAGFIAQELDELQQKAGADWLNLVMKDNREKIEATYGNLLPVMVKAIQELKAENDKLKEEISALKSIEERMTELELRVIKNDVLKEIMNAEK